MRCALGVVLAGGRGTRLGGDTPKALARLDGHTLLERAIAMLSACCDDWCVATSAEVVLPVEASRLVFDAAGAAGPLAGVVAAFRSRAEGTALVLGVDFPLVRPELLHALADGLEDAAAVLPAPGGMPQPLVAAYGVAARAALVRAANSGEDSILRAALALTPRLLDDAALARLEGGVASLHNVNTPAELAEATRMLAEAGRMLNAAGSVLVEEQGMRDERRSASAEAEKSSAAANRRVGCV